MEQEIEITEMVLGEEQDLQRGVERIRQEVRAFGAAIAEFAAQGKKSGVREIRGAEQPGNKFNRTILIEAFSEDTDGELSCLGESWEQ